MRCRKTYCSLSFDSIVCRRLFVRRFPFVFLSAPPISYHKLFQAVPYPKRFLKFFYGKWNKTTLNYYPYNKTFKLISSTIVKTNRLDTYGETLPRGRRWMRSYTLLLCSSGNGINFQVCARIRFGPFDVLFGLFSVGFHSITIRWDRHVAFP